MDTLAPTTRRNAASSQDVPLELIDVPEDSLRRIPPTAQQDEGMLASVRTLGVLQPVILRASEAGRFGLIAGRRRLRAAIAATAAAADAAEGLMRGTEIPAGGGELCAGTLDVSSQPRAGTSHAPAHPFAG